MTWQPRRELTCVPDTHCWPAGSASWHFDWQVTEHSRAVNGQSFASESNGKLVHVSVGPLFGTLAYLLWLVYIKRHHCFCTDDWPVLYITERKREREHKTFKITKLSAWKLLTEFIITTQCRFIHFFPQRNHNNPRNITEVSVPLKVVAMQCEHQSKLPTVVKQNILSSSCIYWCTLIHVSH